MAHAECAATQKVFSLVPYDNHYSLCRILAPSNNIAAAPD